MDLKKLLQISRTDKQLGVRLEMAEVIARVLSGVGTEEEKQKLESWLKESPVHVEEFNRIQLKIKVKPEEMLDMEMMWKEFQQRLPQKTFSYKSVLHYAALFILPLCLATWLCFEFRPVIPEHSMEAAEIITPGKYKAQLILADGKEVNITEETDVQIQDESGIRISSAGNTLQYEVDSTKMNTLHYNTLAVPVGGEFAIQLSDSTKVWLNSGSKLKYPMLFSGNLREVEIEGEGYFEVSKDEHKPFIVHVNGMSVQVLGTTFNISAYDQQTITTLITGKVRLSKGEQKVELHPGEQAIAAPEEQGFKIQKVNARNFALWKDGVFWFENTDLKTILDNLARWYDVEVFYVAPELKELRFSMEMKRYEDITTVLRKIEYTQKVRFTIRDRMVSVEK